MGYGIYNVGAAFSRDGSTLSAVISRLKAAST